MIHHQYKGRSKRRGSREAGVVYEQRKRLDFPAIVGRGQTRNTAHGSAHQAPARGSDLAHTAASGSAERAQPACVRRRDHVRRILSRAHRNQCARRRLAGVSLGDDGSADDQQRHGRRRLVGGGVCICVSNLLGNAVRGTGNMSFPAAVLIGCVVVHIVISPVLIFGVGPLPALGPAGAGWGLVIPFAGGSAVMIWYLRSSRALVRLNFRGVMPRWELFADILKVGVPGLINIAITNLSVVVLTGIAGRLGRDAALGYAMGVRLEYIMQPIAFGFGTAIVAMVGTNWGAQQYRRAREIAWTGATTVAVVCGTIGLIVAFQPGLWIGLFSDDAEVARLGTLYLRVVGPAYICFGLGLGLFYVTLGVGRAVTAMNANAVRMVVSAGGGLVAIYWLDLGVAGFFAAVAAGFCLYAAILVYAVSSVSIDRRESSGRLKRRLRNAVSIPLPEASKESKNANSHARTKLRG